MKKTWSIIIDILHKNKQNTKLPVYFKHGEKKISDKKDIADKFNTFFTNIGKKLADKIEEVPHRHISDYLVSKPNTKFEFQPVEIKEINKIITQLDSKSSSGYDSISNILILGDDSLFTNYRPISLPPSTSKIVERVIFNKLYAYFETNGLFYGSQYGFRKRHEFAALGLVDKLLNMMDKGQVPLGIFLDLSKAFNTLDHNILIKKLKFYGVSDGPGKLLESYLSNRKQFVVFDDIDSQVLDLKTGVPQGSILGPLLFLIYINDIVKSSNFSKFILFADDTTIFAPINTNNKETANIINMELEKIITWLKLNKLSLNISKTKFCIFHKVQRKVSILEIQIENTVISNPEVVDFLGFRLDENLNWNDHIEKQSSKLSRTLEIINKKVNHVFATKCISHNIPNLINQLPNEIRDKFHTHSFSGFVLYTRKYFIKMYQPQCFIENCYVCRR